MTLFILFHFISFYFISFIYFISFTLFLHMINCRTNFASTRVRCRVAWLRDKWSERPSLVAASFADWTGIFARYLRRLFYCINFPFCGYGHILKNSFFINDFFIMRFISFTPLNDFLISLISLEWTSYSLILLNLITPL